jgi:hypothetical protein
MFYAIAYIVIHPAVVTPPGENQSPMSREISVGRRDRTASLKVEESLPIGLVIGETNNPFLLAISLVAM